LLLSLGLNLDPNHEKINQIKKWCQVVELIHNSSLL